MAAQPLTLVLNRGGLAGLVATSAALAADAGPGPPRVGLVFVDDGRDDAVVRREAARRQADFFGLTRLDELALPGLFSGASARGTRPRLAEARLNPRRCRGRPRRSWSPSSWRTWKNPRQARRAKTRG